MRTRYCSPLLAATLLMPMVARAEGPFDAALREIGTALHARPEHPHLLGMAAFLACVAHPKETRGLHLAIFAAPAGLDLDAAIGNALDGSWSRLVRTVERRSQEQALVYVREDGSRFDLLVLSLDGDRQLVVATLRVSPEEMVGQVEKHREGSF